MKEFLKKISLKELACTMSGAILTLKEAKENMENIDDMNEEIILNDLYEMAEMYINRTVEEDYDKDYFLNIISSCYEGKN